MHISICDDNVVFASKIEEVIVRMKIFDAETEVFTSGDELLAFCETEERSQIYFLDIEMPGTDGIETARRIREKDSRALIVFMTQYHEHVYSVFEVLPFRFMRKPFTDDDVRQIMNACLEQLKMSQRYYFFKCERVQRQIPYDEIIYFEGRGRKVCLHSTSGEYEFYEKISSVAEDVDKENFCRIHVSFVINMDAVRAVRDTEVELRDGMILPISKAYRQEVKQYHLEYMIRKSGM